MVNIYKTDLSYEHFASGTVNLLVTFDMLAFITKPVVLAGVCVLVTYLVVSRVARAQRLWHIPGPPWAPWTTLWLLRRQLKRRVARDLAELTKQYGPIYRVAPNYVVISDPAEVRRVWHIRGPWSRSAWYDMFRFDQSVETVFSEQDNAAHAAIRAKLQPGYSGKDVDNMHSVVDRRVADLVDLIERKYLSSGDAFRPMDLAEKAQFLALDIISELAIGNCFECLREDRDTYGHIAAVSGSVPLMTLMATVPASLALLRNPIVRSLLPKDKLEGIGRMNALAQKNAAARFGPDKIVRRDMLGSFVAHGVTPDSAWLETFGQIGAGSDTTATAIRMILFYLISDAPSYHKLQAEIDEAVCAGRISAPVTDDEARRLPYLQAVIREGMRVWPPVTGLMPKICDTEQTVCGVRVPPGTNVCWEAVSVMHNRDVFGDDATCFRPERWLEAEARDPERRRNMEQVQMLCFMASTRWECLGKTIALIEINKSLVEVSFSMLDTFQRSISK